MTDAEFIFRKEVQEKKRNGYGARNKKNGSKSKKCTLPSDYMTRKEKQALNGEVKSWDLKKFYSYEEFKQMPDDIQIEYVNSILSRYDVGIHAIESIVFERSGRSCFLHKHFQQKGLSQYLNKFPGGRPKKSNIERLKKDVEKSRHVLATVKSVEETDQGLKVEANLNETNPEVLKFIHAAMDSVPEAPEHPGLATEISDFLIRMDRFDDRIWEWIKELFALDDNLQITISINKAS